MTTSVRFWTQCCHSEAAIDRQSRTHINLWNLFLKQDSDQITGDDALRAEGIVIRNLFNYIALFIDDHRESLQIRRHDSPRHNHLDNHRHNVHHKQDNRHDSLRRNRS